MDPGINPIVVVLCEVQTDVELRDCTVVVAMVTTRNTDGAVGAGIPLDIGAQGPT